MVSRNFAIQLAVRLGLLFLAMVGLVWLLIATDFIIAPVLLALICFGQMFEILMFVQRTNRELSRFLETVRHADFSQSFSRGYRGTGFSELGQTLTRLMDRFRAFRAEQETEIRYLRAIVDHVPVPLISLGPEQRITLLNNAARRFFAPATIEYADDLDLFGPELKAAVTELAPGDRRLVRLNTEDGMPRRAALSVTEIIIGKDAQRLIALQNISTELEATELEAWQQLVRVLTHEIMNSLTPVSSLAETAADLLRSANGEGEAHNDAKVAVETVAQRAGALMAFVQSYRRFTRLPAPRPQRIKLEDLFARLQQLAASDRDKRGIELDVSIKPEKLVLNADPEQVEQILINLVQNAIEAVEGQTDGRITLSARKNRHGRTVIEVADNGPGIAGDVADQIFVPFFTTKRGGSGIGLALTRQVMIAHKGFATAGRSAAGGALFTLTF